MKKNPARNVHLVKGPTNLLEKINLSIDVDSRLYKEDIEASIAHVKMLSKTKIISSSEGKIILKGLNNILKDIAKGKVKFSNKHEDIHMNIEALLFKKVGNVAGKLHTARSRNDQVVTDFKLWVKDSSLILIKELNSLMKNIVNKADKNVGTVMPGFTHLKNAQPVSFAHYLLAYYEMLNRDKKRFQNN